MDPHTTKVPAEKKLIKRDNPLIHHGNAPPAAKKDFMLLPDLAKDIPHTKTSAEKTITTQTSILPTCNFNLMLTSHCKPTDYLLVFATINN